MRVQLCPADQLSHCGVICVCALHEPASLLDLLWPRGAPATAALQSLPAFVPPAAVVRVGATEEKFHEPAVPCALPVAAAAVELEQHPPHYDSAASPRPTAAALELSPLDTTPIVYQPARKKRSRPPLPPTAAALPHTQPPPPPPPQARSHGRNVSAHRKTLHWIRHHAT